MNNPKASYSFSAGCSMEAETQAEMPYSSLKEATIESVIFDLELENIKSCSEWKYDPCLVKYITHQSSLVNKRFHDHYFVMIMSEGIRENMDQDILADLRAETKRNPPPS